MGLLRGGLLPTSSQLFSLPNLTSIMQPAHPDPSVLLSPRPSSAPARTFFQESSIASHVRKPAQVVRAELGLLAVFEAFVFIFRMLRCVL